MRKAVAALVVTVVAVILVAGYDTEPPTTFNPNSALRRPPARPSPSPAPTPADPNSRTAVGAIRQTPFSVIQVQATLTDGRLTDVRTLELSGSDPKTEAINRRAEPLLRASALKARSADIDVVTGATYTSRSWIDSLEAAIEEAGG
jgi:uncharacterized protein with FMN-binding domain